MSDEQEHIEAYFKEQLTESDKRRFEERCVQDEAFARQVAEYIMMQEGIRQALLREKQEQWGADRKEEGGPAPAPVIKITAYKWIGYAAAACIGLVIVYIAFFQGDSPHERAQKYIAGNFIYLSQTMGGNDTMHQGIYLNQKKWEDNLLQQGIEAYNKGDYTWALQAFEQVYQSNPTNSGAKKNIGLVYLITEQYDKALIHFEQLAGMPGLYSNPGLFLQAVTLLKKNRPEDRARAKGLLQQVAASKTEGSTEAEEWLRKW